MAFTRRQAHALHLAGTVSVPPTFPELGKLSLDRGACCVAPHGKTAPADVLCVEQELSPRVCICRKFLLSDVSAVFIPRDPGNVSLSDGSWLLTGEINQLERMEASSGGGLLGIAYVAENAQSLLQVEVGMTAAESVEYYPPLPDDRSANHYQFTDCPDVGPPGGTCPDARPRGGMCPEVRPRMQRATTSCPEANRR
jgi:hypothetical protein